MSTETKNFGHKEMGVPDPSDDLSDDPSGDLLSSFEARMHKCSKPIMAILTCLDVNSIGHKEMEVPDPSDDPSGDLLSSFEARMHKCSKPIMAILTCLDVNSIVGLLCG